MSEMYIQDLVRRLFPQAANSRPPLQRPPQQPAPLLPITPEDLLGLPTQRFPGDARGMLPGQMRRGAPARLPLPTPFQRGPIGPDYGMDPTTSPVGPGPAPAPTVTVGGPAPLVPVNPNPYHQAPTLIPRSGLPPTPRDPRGLN